ncbi:pyridoxamine 5'-phosphate oxidase family protein [Aliiglaciecola sp. CAU 1673]|nr:pyridoxamine 5'-phosphate oxidase family protein [Aliiglaciecola sp. CAU 1673]
MTLESIRRCFEGTIPSCIATCGLDGVANVSYVSQAYFVDSQHIALTFQFFNKTHKNVCENPVATLVVIDPITVAKYRLSLRYLRTETEGALFEGMKARLNSIAHTTHMENVFKLQGADIYQVTHIELTSNQTQPLPPFENRSFFPVRQAMQSLAQAKSMEEVFETLAQAAQQITACANSLVLIKEGPKLFTIHSSGYEHSGVGAEIPMGVGVIGIAAQQHCPIRLTQQTSEYNYLRFLSAAMAKDQVPADLETNILYPGLENPKSQLAIPFGMNPIQGVIYLESSQEGAFDYHDEDAITCLATCAAQQLESLASNPMQSTDKVQTAQGFLHSPNKPVSIKYLPDTHCIFIDNDYIIKGVAGAILWRILQLYQTDGRTQFSNKELRNDNAIFLPDIKDNFETRLILLRRRLQEKGNGIRLIPTGRGKFELRCPTELALS